MQSLKISTRRHAALTGLLGGIAAAALVATVTFAPRPAAAKPEYAAQTKLACGQCHVSPAGGGALKRLGAKFQANGHKLK